MVECADAGADGLELLGALDAAVRVSVQVIQDWQADLIYLSIKTPAGSCPQTYRRIRTNPCTRNIGNWTGRCLVSACLTGAICVADPAAAAADTSCCSSDAS